ncbi:MAG: hypothetical protein AAF593_01235 [Planctomycetota bacterium]
MDEFSQQSPSELVRRISGTLKPSGPVARRVTLEDALDVAWAVTGVGVEAITSGPKTPGVVAARTVVCEVLRTLGRFSFAEIAEMVGYELHTSARAAVSRAWLGAQLPVTSRAYDHLYWRGLLQGRVAWTVLSPSCGLLGGGEGAGDEG